ILIYPVTQQKIVFNTRSKAPDQFLRRFSFQSDEVFILHAANRPVSKSPIEAVIRFIVRCDTADGQSRAVELFVHPLGGKYDAVIRESVINQTGSKVCRNAVIHTFPFVIRADDTLPESVIKMVVDTV